MTTPIWTWDELLKAVPFARADGAPPAAITGFSIDTRSLQPGNVFVALKDQRDGHEFVGNAFKAGAAAALVSEHYDKKPGDGALIRCVLKGGREDHATLVALECIGSIARQRLSPQARVIAVTGSAGKTGTKEMLRACLSRLGKTHASEKSYNNHWGVPLTLANMAADTRYGVFEIGMNHAGEIKPLSQMVRPHAAIITTVEAVHLEHFASIEEIADAKAEIFHGLVPGGAAIIKRDNPHFERLEAQALAHDARVISFGLSRGADVSASDVTFDEDGTDIRTTLGGKTSSFRVAIPGRHIAENALAVAAALSAVGADVETGLKALAGLPPPAGRGARTELLVEGGSALLIDESYNANPASMRASLATLASVSRHKFPRRIAVLGDMLELGPQSAELHLGLKDAVHDAGVAVLFACGPHMKGLYDAVNDGIKGAYAATAAGLQETLISAIQAGDVVMIKGSNGTRLQPVVAALKEHFAAPAASTHQA